MGDGIFILLAILAGVALLIAYGIPALILFFTKKANRTAAKIALFWSALPLGVFVFLRTGARREVRDLLGGSGSVALLLILVPTALIDWRAWTRLQAPREESQVAPVPAGEPIKAIPNLIALWLGAELAHAAFAALSFEFARGTNEPIAARATLMLVAALLGWLLLGTLQWLILKRAAIDASWIAATFAAGLVSHFVVQGAVNALMSFSGGYGFGVALTSALITGAMLAFAQWLCIPRRFGKRNLWLVAVPALDAVASFVYFAQARMGSSSITVVTLERLLNAGLVGLGGAFAMQAILASDAAQPAATPSTDVIA